EAGLKFLSGYPKKWRSLSLEKKGLLFLITVFEAVLVSAVFICHHWFQPILPYSMYSALFAFFFTCQHDSPPLHPDHIPDPWKFDNSKIPGQVIKQYIYRSLLHLQVEVSIF